MCQKVDVVKCFSKMYRFMSLSCLSCKTVEFCWLQEKNVTTRKSGLNPPRPLSKRTWSRTCGGQQEDFHLNRIDAELISIAWSPSPLDRVLLLKVTNIQKINLFRWKVFVSLLSIYCITYSAVLCHALLTHRN